VNEIMDRPPNCIYCEYQFLSLATALKKAQFDKTAERLCKAYILRAHFDVFFGRDFCNQIKTLYGLCFIVLNLAQQANTYRLNVRKAFSLKRKRFLNQ